MAEKPKILLIDHDEQALRSLIMLQSSYRIVATRDCFEALKVLRREKIHVILADERMPIVSGVEFLRQARYIAPNAARILLTYEADSAKVFDPLGRSDIFGFMSRPWDIVKIQTTLELAVAHANQLDELPVKPTLLPIPILANPLAEAEQEHITVPKHAITEAESLTILVLDRDESTYTLVHDILPTHDVLWSETIDDALKVLNAESVAILVTELSLGNDDMRNLFDTLQHQHPDLLTVVLSEQTDISFLSELTRRGQVHRYLPKPARQGILARNLQSTIVHYRTLKTQRAERRIALDQAAQRNRQLRAGQYAHHAQLRAGSEQAFGGASGLNLSSAAMIKESVAHSQGGFAQRLRGFGDLVRGKSQLGRM